MTRRILSLSEVEPGMVVTVEKEGGDRYVRKVTQIGGGPLITNADLGIFASFASLERLVAEGFSVSVEVEDQEHDHAGEPKVWCETHQHTHIASIPRFTFHCKSCGFGGWYKPDADAHEAAHPFHETYEVEHVVRPVVEVEETPEPTDREELVAIIDDPNHRGPYHIADAVIAAGWSPPGSEAQKIADWLRTQHSVARLSNLADAIERGDYK